jgi:hypothetical protein
VPGFPIRTPSDHSSVDSSPRTIAASHVLHRLLMPRHPPCALDNLTNTPANITKKHSAKLLLEKQQQRTRCSRPLYNSQRPHGPPRHTPRASQERPPAEKTHFPPPDRRLDEPATPGAGTVVLSGPNSAPTFRCFHIFSSNPTHLPEPATTPEGTASRPVLVGPSTTNAGMDADTRRADHTHPAVFGEAP